MIKTYDCAVIGMGISGVLLAKKLAHIGLKVAVFHDNKPTKTSFAENLPASINPLLTRLGLHQYLHHSAHFPCSGTYSSWGSAELQLPHVDSALQKKPGWKVDKSYLVSQLIADLPKSVVMFDKVIGLEQQNAHWQLNSQNSSGEPLQVMARFVADASGRRGYLPRMLNIPRHYFDKLMAFVVNVPSVKIAQCQHPVLVEAQQHCWSLVSQISNESTMLAIFSNQASPDFERYNAFENWREMCKNSIYFKQFIRKNDHIPVRKVNASSHICRQLTGNNWLILGDAAMSFDPLSSHGMTTAMYMADKAGDAIAQYFSGQSQVLDEYSEKMASIYNTYLNELVKRYNAEQRWRCSPFWQSKQTLHVSNDGVLVI
jgi:flavin-dependent dehydrogenase